MNEHNLNDQVLQVSRFESKDERFAKLKKIYEDKKEEYLRKYQNSNLFLKNLDDQIDDARLRTEFFKFGSIKSAKVMLDKNDQSKGFGFVCFETNEQAKTALAEMNGRILATKPLFVAMAQRKEVRKKILAAKFKERFLANQYILPNIDYYVNSSEQFLSYQNATVPRWQNQRGYPAQQSGSYFQQQHQPLQYYGSQTVAKGYQASANPRPQRPQPFPSNIN